MTPADREPGEEYVSGDEAVGGDAAEIPTADARAAGVRAAEDPVAQARIGEVSDAQPPEVGAMEPGVAVPGAVVPPRRNVARWLIDQLRRPLGNGRALVLAVLMLAAVNYLLHRAAWVRSLPDLVVAFAVTGLFAGLAWWSGHALEELGLDRKSWPLGLKWSAIIIAGVALVYLAGALLPATRSLFTDERYASLTAAQVAVRVFVDVPFATVLAEEVAFRGVLFGLALRRWQPLWATAFSALMFGCWHILSSLHLNTEKPALTSLLGPSELGAALADLGTVVFTGLGGAVFCELRRRSGSLLVPMSFHWATNALGYGFGFLVRVGVVPGL